MDVDKLTFLYGEQVDADRWDLDDPDQRSTLLEQSFPEPITPRELISFEIIANQILDDQPPEVWTTVQRLLDLGLDRQTILGEIVVAFAPTLHATIDGEVADDRVARYLAALDRLPLPNPAAVARAMVEITREQQGIPVDELVATTLDRTDAAEEDEIAEDMADFVLEELTQPDGPLAWMAADLIVHVEDLTEGIVLTHRLTEPERSLGFLPLAFDLAGFSRVVQPTLPDGRALTVGVGPEDVGHLGWTGPTAWLDDHAAGSVIAVRVDADHTVTIETTDPAPAVDPVLVERLRAAYDAEISEVWHPVSGEDLVLAVLLDRPTSFDEPLAPLGDLCEAAGLDRRHDAVAHDPAVWRYATISARHHRVVDAFGPDDEAASKVLRALHVADLVAGIDPALVPEIEGPVDTAMLRSVLTDLRDEDVLSTFATELFDSPDADLEGGARAVALVAALVAAAGRPQDVAVARVLAALQAERALDPLAAEQHLHLAHEADPDLVLVIDRLAWYASDHGDAPRAARLWRQLMRTPGLVEDLEVVEQFEAPRSALPGRNDPCWCGSGRKFKQCHLGATDLAPLPDRVGWLWRKAVAYLERADRHAQDDVITLAFASAADPDDKQSLMDALDDPIVMDLALTEGGWFARFLEARGPLLPDDELELARSWLPVARTVYEVDAVRPGVGFDLKDLRSGRVVPVRESTSPGFEALDLLCARAVPDGDTNQLVGAVVPVPPGREAALLERLADGDPELIAEEIAALRHPEHAL